jgi:glycerol kinase
VQKKMFNGNVTHIKLVCKVFSDIEVVQDDISNAYHITGRRGDQRAAGIIGTGATEPLAWKNAYVVACVEQLEY